MSHQKKTLAGAKRPAAGETPGEKASRVQFDQVGRRFRGLLLASLNRAELRADYSSSQRFEFLEVPALALQAMSARLANA